MADATSPPRTPRWVKWSAALALVLVALVAVLLLTGGAGEHGPGRHTGPGEGGGQNPPANVTEDATPPGSGGHTPPPGGHAP